MKKTSKLIFETVAAMLAIIIFYFLQGAVVVTQGLTGANAKWAQSIFIWASVIFAIIFFLIKYKTITCLGFKNPDWSEFKRLLFCIPMLVIALSGCINGIDFSNKDFILASLVLTIGVGFSEEIYFRGIIFNIWLENRSKAKAIVISSILFGVTHLMNVLGGAGLVETILQIFFALFYGVIMAIIMIHLKSIWACIILHFLHDFCSWIGQDGSPKEEIILATIQTVILLGYMVYLIYKEKKENSK